MIRNALTEQIQALTQLIQTVEEDAAKHVSNLRAKRQSLITLRASMSNDAEGVIDGLEAIGLLRVGHGPNTP